MVGWHHWFNGHEFEQTLGHSEGKSGMLQSMESQKSLTWLRNWTTTIVQNMCVELQGEFWNGGTQVVKWTKEIMIGGK